MSIPRNVESKKGTNEVFSDERFNIIFQLTKEINGNLRELERITITKIENLIGNQPVNPQEEAGVDSACWVDLIIKEQKETLLMINECLNNLGSL